MTAEDWATTVSSGEFRRAPESLDAEAVRCVPAFAADVQRIAEAMAVAQYRRREELESDPSRPGRRASGAPSPVRSLAGLGGVASPIVAFGLVFSRAALDIAGSAPWWAALLALGAALTAAAVLPVRTSPPPGRDRLFFAAVGTALGVATLAGTLGRAASGGVPVPVVWVVVAVMAVVTEAVLASAIQLARARAPRSTVVEADGAATAWADRLGAELHRVAEEHIEELSSVWGALDDSDRARVRDELARAAARLERRGLIVDPDAAVRHVPGLLVLEARAIGLPPGERLHPALEGAPHR